MNIVLISALLVIGFFTYSNVNGVCLNDTEYDSYMMTNLMKDIEGRIKSFRQNVREMVKDKCPVRSCKDEWISYNKSCYYFEIVNTKTFEDARVYCQQNDAILLYVNDEAENSFITKILHGLKSSSLHWFSGLTDQGSEGSWRWIDTDVPVKFTKWSSGEPGGGTRENCVNYLDRGTKLWHDVPCLNKYLFICKTEM